MICSAISLFTGQAHSRILLKVVFRELNGFFPCYAIESEILIGFIRNFLFDFCKFN